jgi:hypothetical protein
MKIRLVESILRMGEEGYSKMMEGVNLTKIYGRTFVNVTVYPQYNNNMLIKIKFKGNLAILSFLAVVKV